MDFPWFDHGPVTINNQQTAFFELNPVNQAGISKRPTWMAGAISGFTPNQSADGMNCNYVPDANFVGTSSAVCDVWFNDGNAERHHWQVTVTASPTPAPARTKLNPSVEIKPKFA